MVTMRNRNRYSRKTRAANEGGGVCHLVYSYCLNCHSSFWFHAAIGITFPNPWLLFFLHATSNWWPVLWTRGYAQQRKMTSPLNLSTDSLSSPETPCSSPFFHIKVNSPSTAVTSSFVSGKREDFQVSIILVYKRTKEHESSVVP